MGRLIVTEFITVDGVIDSPGELGWVFKFNRSEDGEKFKFDELKAADAQLLGRITYQGFAQAWPAMNADDFGKKMNSMPKYVVSTTLTAAEATWENSTVISADVAAEAQGHGGLRGAQQDDGIGQAQGGREIAGEQQQCGEQHDADAADRYRPRQIVASLKPIVSRCCHVDSFSQNIH